MNIEKLSKILKESNNIVFFGGAGISTESGIPDFRSETGLYKTDSGHGYPPEVMLSHTFFIKHTKDFFKFYKEKMIYINAKPNSAHLILARLEEMSKLKAVITQNIDGLHQAAGSKNVYELHGSVHRNYCAKCHAFYNLDFILESKNIPKCPHCNGTVKPDVVLYEEGLDNDVINGAVNAIEHADTLIIGGTSLAVYPAAGLVNYFKGKNLILINKSSTPYDSNADLVIHDSIGKVLSEALNNL
ncbi:MAG: NAD-dependent protein deacylase [Clostridium sp.]|uniref:NAD-dependent protein deacylase n=1 Tax=Clostridium sp. TaxID=1506 RepID=UPI0025BB00CC|nr:NAD-dependent protein deacylase [Clostridium sp.]MCE5220985.1 NAD-dependent protein deacylase [Clostridium sp.]